MPRTAEQIESELDQWQTQRTETQEALAGLKESLEALRTQLPKDGNSPELVALTGQLAELKQQLVEDKATIAELKTELASLPRPSPSPRPSPGPAPTDGNDGDPPPAPGPRPGPLVPPSPERTTRTGLKFL